MIDADGERQTKRWRWFKSAEIRNGIGILAPANGRP
jgi:hypothetical protein